MPKNTNEITKVDPALANGAFGKDAIHSRRSLEERKGRTTPRSEPEVKAAKAKKAPTKKAAPKAPKGNRLSLKQNAPIRSQLKEAAQKLGGTRLQPIGFASFTEFLAGVPLDADGNAEVTFIPVKGSEPVQGAGSVVLTITARVAKVTTKPTKAAKAK